MKELGMRKMVFVVAALALLAGCPKKSGSAGGAGAAGGAGTGGGTGLCAMADKTATPSALHTAAHDVLAVASPCGFSSCHAGSQARAMLKLLDATDLKATLVGKPSCEAPMLPLVDGSGGDAALSHSYLWLKLTAPVDLSAVLTGSAAWGMATASCGQDQPTQTYGVRMPKTGTDMMLDAPRLDAIRNWICAGAPGP
jgi:hypothetical protein